MTIADHLIPKLRERFPNRALKITGKLQPCAIFPAIHPDVGDIVIHDDGDEITLEAGNFTHGHFSNYDDSLSDTEKDEMITNDVLDFLDHVFADRVAFWRTHAGGGGWYRRDLRSTGQSTWPLRDLEPLKQMQYVWSGPVVEPAKPDGLLARMVRYLRGSK